MKNKDYIFVSIIIIIVILVINISLYISGRKTKDNVVDGYDSELIKIQNKIIKINNKNEKQYYYLKERNIYNRNNKSIIGTKFNGTGIIINDSNNVKIYIQNDENHCYIRTNNTNSIYNGKCKIEDTASIGSEQIEKTMLSLQLKDDVGNNKQGFDSKQYYYGKNPNNYIIFENSCYRIINIAQNNSLKVIYESNINEYGNCYYQENGNIGFVALLSWDKSTKEKPDWKTSKLANKMTEWVSAEKIDMINIKVNLNINKIEMADWNIGSIKNMDNSFSNLLLMEKKEIYSSKMGLLNISDYIKASGEVDFALNKQYINNYLYKPNYDYWTISSLDSDKEKMAWQLTLSGTIEPMTITFSKDFSYSGIRPVMYLKHNINLTGTGADVYPYKLIDLIYGSK